MHLGSIYLIVNDFEKSIDAYEKQLEMPESLSFKLTKKYNGVAFSHSIIA